MSALDRPTPGELRRGAIAAAVRDGRLTAHEAQILDRRKSSVTAEPSPSAVGEIVSRVQFARLAKVTPGRVSQWISEGKISGRALVGEGRDAQIRTAQAFAELQAIISPAYRSATPTMPSALRAG